MVLTRAEDGLGGAVRLSETLASRIPNAFYLDQVGLLRFNIIPNKIIVIFTNHEDWSKYTQLFYEEIQILVSVFGFGELWGALYDDGSGNLESDGRRGEGTSDGCWHRRDHRWHRQIPQGEEPWYYGIVFPPPVSSSLLIGFGEDDFDVAIFRSFQ